MIAIQLIILAIAVSGVASLYQYCIQPGQIFGFIQPLLVWLQKRNLFLYKRLGGCVVCNVQSFADVAFLVIYLIFWSGTWWQALLTYILFSGLVFYFYGIAASLKDKKADFKTNKQTLEL